MNRLIVFILLLFCFGQPQPAACHESQPGTIDIVELGPAKFKITWRAPIYYGRPHPAELILPDEWRTIGQPTQVRRQDDIIFEITVSTEEKSINGQTIRLAGLESTITNVFVKVKRTDGSQVTILLSPTHPSTTLRGERVWYVNAREYLALGFHHILSGVDHLLFVFGLMLIVSGGMMLLKTITSFTLAHSITLAIATLGYAQAPLLPVNATIALSILFLGPEIIRAEKGETSLTIRLPWLIAFGFGLLHGFGFASGLKTIGLPSKLRNRNSAYCMDSVSPAVFPLQA